MKNTFKTQLWISFGIVLVAIAASAGAFYYFSGNIDATANKILTDKTFVARQTAAVGSLAVLKSDAPLAARYQAAIDKLLPPHDDLIGFDPALDALANKHGVTVSFTFNGDNAPANPATPGSDGFTVQADGAASDLSAFLTDLEGHGTGFLVAIDSYDFTNAGANYHLTIQGKIFSK